MCFRVNVNKKRRSYPCDRFRPNHLEVERTWHIIDADGKTLGRLASRIALILRGKHKPTYTTNVDTGDHVIVINTSRIQLTRNKFQG